MRQLEARIYELEHNNSPQTNAPNQSSGQPQITQYPRGPAFSELREPLQGDYLASASHPSSVAGHVESSALWQSVRREPEVLPAVIGAATNESRAQERYGSSSAGSFMQHVREVVEKRTNSPSTGQSQIRVPDADEQPLMVPKEDSDQKHHDWALPTRKRADDLMTTYWDVVHPLYPFLGKRMTTADYENLWTGAALIPHERSYLCLLNLLFAMSSQLTESVPPRDRESASNVFYERARGLLELRDSACIRYVQIYLLFALYLQSTNAGHECWIFTGLAIRTAQTLELHKPETNERPSNARIRSLLRRVWYACVLLDRVLSMTYGRPCMISRRVALSVPQCVPVEGEERYLEADLSLALYPSEKPAMVDFFNQSLALYDILYDILTNFYASEPPLAQTLDEVYQYFFEGARGFSHEATVLQIEGKLASWKKALPSHLRMSSHSERNRPVTMLSRQATILHQRYYLLDGAFVLLADTFIIQIPPRPSSCAPPRTIGISYPR